MNKITVVNQSQEFLEIVQGGDTTLVKPGETRSLPNDIDGGTIVRKALTTDQFQPHHSAPLQRSV